MSSCSAASRREAPPSTRAITRMRMSAEYAFGIVRPPDESMPPDSPTYRSLGTLRFYSARTCSRIRFGSGRQRRAHFPRLLHHPRPIARERRDAGEAAAAFAQSRAGRPAHHTDHCEHATDLARDRRAGITGTGAESGALAFGGGVGEPDLQRPRLAGGDKRRGAHRAAGLAVAMHGDAIAGHHEAVAGG